MKICIDGHTCENGGAITPSSMLSMVRLGSIYHGASWDILVTHILGTLTVTLIEIIHMLWLLPFSKWIEIFRITDQTHVVISVIICSIWCLLPIQSVQGWNYESEIYFKQLSVFVVNTSRFFRHSWPITGLVTRFIRRVSSKWCRNCLLFRSTWVYLRLLVGFMLLDL